MAVADPKNPDTAVRVEKGDTLWQIAKDAGLTLKEIRDLNPAIMADPKYNGGSTIFSNTKINIAPPVTKTVTPTSTPVDTGFDAARAAAEAAAAAAAKAAADAAAKAAADKAAADAAAAAARTQAERDAAAAAQAAAAEAARLAAIAAANANNGVSGVYSGTGNINTSVTQAPPTTTQAAALVAGATTLSAADKARLDALEVMKARFKQYGLETLVEKIRQLAIEGASESTITLQLQETPEYQARFKANTVRLKNNLAVLAPAEYLAVEDSYRQTLRAYGLTQFDTDEYVSQFIANDVSPTELSNRVQLAVQRVQNADPAISKTLRDYYGIGQADLVAYTLDPATQFKKIERQVQAAEIGTAARLQGLETGVGVAEQLAAQGVTQAEAQKGYATIADILPTAEKLSAIYGTTLEGYGQSQAEQEVFNTLASAQRARQKLTAREVAQFGGTSGLAKTALSTGSGQIQNPERTHRPRQRIRPIARANLFPRIESVACELQRIEGWVAMSNNYWDEEDDNDDVITGNETENDLQKKLRKKIRADEKRIKDLEERLGTFTKIDKERTVKEVLEKQGVNAKAARLILKDLDDVNEESVNNWLEENGDLFGYSPVEGSPAISEENRAAIRKQDNLTAGALTPDRAEDMEMRIDQAQSVEELTRILHS